MHYYYKNQQCDVAVEQAFYDFHNSNLKFATYDLNGTLSF